MGVYSNTWKHIRRSPFQAIAAITTMFLAFLLGGSFFLVSITSSQVLQYFESKPQITVFFNDKADQTDINNLKTNLEMTGKTASIKYVSKEDALAIYREQNKSDPLLLELVNADILPASLEITAKDPGYLKDLEPEIKKGNGVEEVIYQKDVVDSLIKWTKAIRITGAILAGLLVFDSLLIIITVIGMKIALKKEEIDILKLVGASRWYIRMPFILEGGFYGAVGSIFAWLVNFILILWARAYVLSFLGVVPLIVGFLSNPLSKIFILYSLISFFVIFSLGLILGMAGSLLSVGRYLK
jgi:cell division transport system permease protein